MTNFASLGKCPQYIVHALNLQSVYDVISPIARMYGFKNYRVEMELDSLIIIPKNPLANFLFPIL